MVHGKLLASMRCSCLLVLLLYPAVSWAAVVNSPELGFSADFPMNPEVNGPAPSEKDNSGKILSNSVTYQGQTGDVMLTVVVNMFTNPTKIDVISSLKGERNRLIDDASASLTSSRVDTFESYPATYFTFEAHRAKGRGLVVIEEKAVPKIYIVTAIYARENADSIAAVDRFMDSFRLN
jgi:hypothetical protein